MANTTAVYARIDSNLKRDAEGILAQLGITPSSAIQMLYSQVVLQRALPFESKLPRRVPLDLSSLTPEQLNAELYRGIDSLNRGEFYTEEQVDDMFAESADELAA